MDVRDSKTVGVRALILREFELSALDGRREKAGHLCTTDQGPVLLQKARASKEALILAHFVKERLNSAGFGNTDRFLTTKIGQPFFELDRELYTVSRFTGGAEARFDDAAGVADFAADLGRMHRITMSESFFKDCPLPLPRHKEHAAFTAEGGFEKQLRVMRGYKKMVQKQSRMSDFDICFLKCFDAYERRVAHCMKQRHHVDKDGVFAHNLLKEETLLTKENRGYITCFDECSGDTGIFDLASVIKRHLRAASMGAPAAAPSQSLELILGRYSAEMPLTPGDKNALYTILLFPDKFYKTCIKYYSKKRTWTPAAFNSALEDLQRGDDWLDDVSGYFGDAQNQR